MTEAVTEEVVTEASELEYAGVEEWETAFYTYRAAQARMATAAGYLVLNEWNTLVNPYSMTASVAGSFMEYLVRVIRAFRSRQMNLARSYLQYIAALEIESPAGEPLFGGDSTRLSTYRDTFLEGVMDAAGMESNEVQYWPTDDDWEFVLSELRQLDYEGASANAKSIPLSDIDLARHIGEFQDSWEADKAVSHVELEWPEDGDHDAAHRQYFEDLVKELSSEADKSRDIDDALHRDDLEEQRTRIERKAEETTRVAGNKLAGQVMQATSDAADQVTAWAMNTDRRIRLVARGTSATPCAFCAMLASRGFAYNSVATAMTSRSSSGGFKRVHPNCQCYPIVRYVDVSELPALNQHFRDMWREAANAEGDSMKNFRLALYAENKDAINARRRRLYHERKMTRITSNPS